MRGWPRMSKRITRLFGMVALLLVALVGVLLLLAGVVLVWLGAMALLPTNWQLPVTLMIALVVLLALLNFVDVWKPQEPRRR